MAAPARAAVAALAADHGAHRLAKREQPKSREGLRAVLTALGFEWRYNLRAMRAELREQGGTWSPATDRLVQDIRSQIPERFTEASGAEGDKRKLLAFGRTAFEDCFGALLHRAETDPFQEWLESLPAWDRAPRLDSWLATVFHVRESGGLAPWCSRYLPLGAVWRTLPPRNQARRNACADRPAGRREVNGAPVPATAGTSRMVFRRAETVGG